MYPFDICACANLLTLEIKIQFLREYSLTSRDKLFIPDNNVIMFEFEVIYDNRKSAFHYLKMYLLQNTQKVEIWKEIDLTLGYVFYKGTYFMRIGMK